MTVTLEHLHQQAAVRHPPHNGQSNAGARGIPRRLRLFRAIRTPPAPMYPALPTSLTVIRPDAQRGSHGHMRRLPVAASVDRPLHAQRGFLRAANLCSPSTPTALRSGRVSRKPAAPAVPAGRRRRNWQALKQVASAAA